MPFPGFEDANATDVLPDFFVVAPRADAPDRAWLIVGDAKDYERIRSRIADARLLKGYLQVAFGAEAAEQWSQRPDGLDVHRFGVLAVPKNAFLQPQAIVEDLHDHREEVRTSSVCAGGDRPVHGAGRGCGGRADDDGGERAQLRGGERVAGQFARRV
jgi:hypothetical protein